MRLPIVAAFVGLIALLSAAGPVRAQVPPDRLTLLRGGLNVVHWFRFPPSTDPGALAFYLSDDTLAAIRRAGFSFIRLPVQPELLAPAGAGLDPARLGALQSALTRIEAAGLAVLVDLQPQTWQLDTSAADRAALLRVWGALAPALAGFDPARTFPEILNEPVFAGQPSAWDTLQGAALAVIRSALPGATVVLTGADWGSIDGLLQLVPPADQNVIYSVHFYEPAVLTTLGAFEPDLDQSALAQLPFPVDPNAPCAPPPGTQARTADVIRFYCADGWNAARITARIGQAADWGRRHGAVVLLGEFGAAAGLRSPSRLAWLRATRRAAEQARFGWTLWGLDDPMGFGASPLAPDQAVFDAGVLAALGLP